MVCDVHTWLVWKLTRSFKTSWASADPLGLFDLKNKRWSPVILDALKLTEGQLPETYRPGTVIGRVTKEASEQTGLSTETLIVAGGGDGQAAGLGANALTSERAYLNLGTAVVAGVYGTQYQTSKAFRTMSACSESGYYYECSLRAGTFAIDWFIKNILNIAPAKHPGIYKQLETRGAAGSRRQRRCVPPALFMRRHESLLGHQRPGSIYWPVIRTSSRTPVPVHSGRHCL